MRNRDYILTQIEKLDNQIMKLQYMLTGQSTAQEYRKELEKTKEVLSNIKSSVEREPLSGYELNKV